MTMPSALRSFAWRLAGTLLAPAVVAAQPLPPNLPHPSPDVPWIASLHADPGEAPSRAQSLARSMGPGTTVVDRLRAMGRVGAAGAAKAPESPAPLPFDAARDPLAEAGRDWPDVLAGLPPRTLLGGEAREEVARLVRETRNARRLCRDGLGAKAAAIDPGRLLSRAIEATSSPDDEAGWRDADESVDRASMLAGLGILARAAQQFRDFARRTELPPILWQADTPEGLIVVDLGRRDDRRILGPFLLVVDGGGNDRYEFTGTPPSGRTSLLIDLAGNDHYLSRDSGADPSTGVLGCGALWDAGGDDAYQGGAFAQGAALGGAALLVDESGDNRFDAEGFAQGFAMNGWALVVTGPGRDRHLARTHAQGSAGPGGVAFLVDEGGDDEYVLASDRIVKPSAQLPGRNASLGQGSGAGLRARGEGDRHRPGGLGALIELGGDDRYRADVFAQGAGLLGGAGVLVDLGGSDLREGAWYVQGAAAHGGAGILVDLGEGRDTYRASHSTSIAAAHDRALGVLHDDGGDDDYRLGDLGFGAAHDGGVAWFGDRGGSDRFLVESARCRAFGTAWRTDPDARRLRFANVGRFDSVAVPPCRSRESAP